MTRQDLLHGHPSQRYFFDLIRPHPRPDFRIPCRNVGKKLADQVLGDAGQDALADAGDETADFADALKLQAADVGTFGNDLEGRAAIAVARAFRHPIP